MEKVLGIDLGGGSLRVGTVSREGALLSLVAKPHRIGAEADPEDWWQALLGLLARIDLSEVKGIGLSGFARSQVLTDAAGVPLRPALCFDHAGAAEVAAEMAHVARGTWTEMSAWHPLARLAWVARTEPAVFARTRMVLQPKDWLALRLTGAAAADKISNAWAIDARGRARNLAPFNRARIDSGLLPELLEPWQAVGRVRGVPGLAGVPVFIGAMDTWCAALGAGVGLGDGYVIAGTTGVAGVVTPEAEPLEGRVTLPWGGGLFHTGGPAGAGGACLDWLAEALGLRDAEAAAGMAQAGAWTPPLLFLPDFAGVRAPLWQAGARGAFLGLEARHQAAELALGVLEGVAMAEAAVIEGLQPARVIVSGGGARSDFWCRIRAGVLGVDVLRAGTAEPGVVGAGLLALVGLGVLEDLDAARDVAQGGMTRFTAMPGAEARYAALRPLFAAARAACLPISAGLAAGFTRT